VFRLVPFVLLAPLQSWGMVVDFILEAMFLEVQSWGTIARWWREFRIHT